MEDKPQRFCWGPWGGGGVNRLQWTLSGWENHMKPSWFMWSWSTNWIKLGYPKYETCGLYLWKCWFGQWISWRPRRNSRSVEGTNPNGVCFGFMMVYDRWWCVKNYITILRRIYIYLAVFWAPKVPGFWPQIFQLSPRVPTFNGSTPKNIDVGLWKIDAQATMGFNTKSFLLVLNAGNDGMIQSITRSNPFHNYFHNNPFPHSHPFPICSTWKLWSSMTWMRGDPHDQQKHRGDPPQGGRAVRVMEARWLVVPMMWEPIKGMWIERMWTSDW